jgi:prepilin-type N-terminal cleavage/methylation domain-containing protein
MKKNGFTLIELLVVVAIIGILAAVGVVAYNGYTNAAKKNIVWSNHAKFLKWINATYMMCVIDENGSVELAQGCKSDGKGGFTNCSPIQTSCSSVFDGGFNQHTNNIWKYWYFQVGARNPFGAMGVNGNMAIGGGDSEDWCKTRMSRCAGYNDYYCSTESDCKLCGYDGEKIRCSNFKLDMR